MTTKVHFCDKLDDSKPVYAEFNSNETFIGAHMDFDGFNYEVNFCPYCGKKVTDLEYIEAK